MRSQNGQIESFIKPSVSEYPVASIVTKPLKYGWYKLRCSLNVKYTAHFEDLVKYLVNNFILVTYWNDTILAISD